jgi:hypothetical protein
MKKSVDKLPISLPLWKNFYDMVVAWDRFDGIRRPLAFYKKEADRMYAETIEDCHDAKDVENIVRYYRRMGWIPKVPHARKSAGKLQHRSKKAS